MAIVSLPVASRVARRAGSRRSGLARLGALAAGLGLLCAALSGPSAASPADAFVTSTISRARRGGRVISYAEPEPAAAAPAPSPSVALVKVTEENKLTTASVLGGLAGLLVGGVWVGGALFLATSYLSRKEEDDDISKALKGVASGSLEVLNYGAYVNDKYEVTDKVGSAISGAIDSAKEKSDNKDTIGSVTGFFDGVAGAIESVDKDIGIKDTLGTLAASASEVACQAVDKAVELNDQYKVTDKIKEKIEEVTSKAASSKSAA